MNPSDENRQGRLSLVGVGPGDPQLLTFRAAMVMEEADAILAPNGRPGGSSNALDTVRQVVDISRKEVVKVHFSMKKVPLAGEKAVEVTASWDNAAREVLKRTDRGLHVAFPTLGDPSIYSTAFYLLATLSAREPDLQIEVIPGITAMSSCSCECRVPLALGDDIFCVIPATFEDDRIRDALAEFDSIVLMKVHRCLPRITGILEETGLLDRAVLVERCGLDGQNIYHDIRDAVNANIHYFSTILVRKRALEILKEEAL